MRTLVRAASVVAVLLALTGCSEPPGRSQAEPSVPPVSASPTAVQFDEDLHDELLGMLKRDQGLDDRLALGLRSRVPAGGTRLAA